MKRVELRKIKPEWWILRGRDFAFFGRSRQDVETKFYLWLSKPVGSEHYVGK